MYDLRLMNSVTIAKKLMDCYPEIQRERIRQQEEDGFWEGTSTLVKRMSFCILGKISAVQLKLCQVRSQGRHLDLPPIEISGL